MMRKRIFLPVMLMIFTIFISCSKKNDIKNAHLKTGKKYIIAVDLIYPPFSFKENNVDKGIDVDLMKAIAKQQGFEVEIVPMDFGGIIPALESGQIDGAIAGANITEARKKVVDFSDPYYDTGIVAIVHKDNTTIKNGKDLVGKRLAVKSGTAGQKYTEENLKGKAEVRIYDDTVSMLKAVENKQADAAFEDLPVISYTLNQDPDTQLKVGTEKLTNVGNGFMVKKGSHQELVREFNQGLKTLRKNGEYKKIIDLYTKGKSSSEQGGIVGVINSYKEIITGYGFAFLRGLLITIYITVVSLFFAVLIGLGVGYLNFIPTDRKNWHSKLIKTLQFLGREYIDLIRGTPLMVQTIFFYFGVVPLLPKFLKMIFHLSKEPGMLSPEVSGIIVIALNAGAFLSEIFRGGIQAIDKGQMEAARSLGLSFNKSMIKVILPQAIKNMIPAILNQFITSLKDTSLLVVIGVADLMKEGQVAYKNNFKTFETMLIVALIYYIVIKLLSKIFKKVEDKLKV